MHGLRRKDLIEGIEADVGDESDAPDQQCTHVAELGTRLDHLGKHELRPLSGMKSHEEGAEGTTRQHRERHPKQMATESPAVGPARWVYSARGSW